MKTLIIQLWQTSLDAPHYAATPFLLAQAARAMDMRVELHALGQSVELFLRNDPRRQHPVPPLNRSLAQYIEDAMAMGIAVRLCSSAIRDRALDQQAFISGDIEVAGMISMVESLSHAESTVLTY